MSFLLSTHAFWASMVVLLALPLIRHRGLTLWLLLLAAASLLASAAYFFANYFTGQGITEAVFYHAHMLLSFNLAKQFWYMWLAVVVFVPAAVGALYLWYRVSNAVSLVVLSRLAYGLLAGILLVLSLVSVLLHPAVTDSVRVAQKLYQQQGPNLLARHLNEQTYHIAAVAPKNFVYLYLESLERIFLDEDRFPGLTPNLNHLLDQAAVIRHVYTAPMTGWTMAGMVSSQCGIPLSTPASASKAVGSISRLVCLGDVLNQQEYYLTFMGGADAEFSKKGRFYSTHGFSEAYGTAELDALAGQVLPKSAWGVYDDKLLEMGFDKFEQLAKTHDRFGLVLLTADTHQPKGHETPECQGMHYGNGKSGMLNSVKCADLLVSRFIERFLASPYAKNVVLVVGSDHLLMGNDAGIEEETDTRENLFAMFQSGQASVHDRQATKFDIAPTLLHTLGFEVDELHFGRNLYKPAPTLSEYYGRSEFNRLLYVWRNRLEAEWANQ